jgi:hypothetical protein
MYILYTLYIASESVLLIKQMLPLWVQMDGNGGGVYH